MLITAGMTGSMIFLLIAGYAGCSKPMNILVLTLAVSIGGLVMSGLGVNHLDLAPPFAGNLHIFRNILCLPFLTFSGFLLPAVCLVVTGYLGCHRIPTVIMVVLSVGFGGLAQSGYQVNHLDIAPPFAGT